MSTIPLRSAYRLLVSCLAYPSIRKMVVVYSSETSVGFNRTTRRCIPEDTVTAVGTTESMTCLVILIDVTEYLYGISLLWPRETRHCTPLA